MGSLNGGRPRDREETMPWDVSGYHQQKTVHQESDLMMLVNNRGTTDGMNGRNRKT